MNIKQLGYFQQALQKLSVSLTFQFEFWWKKQVIHLEFVHFLKAPEEC